MTWTASLMPDDALPPDSLVGTMLNAGTVRPELLAEAASERAELPLWREMLKAGMHAERCDPGTVRHSVAAEIKALRDWLPRRPPKEFYDQLCAELQTYDVTMVGRTMDWLHELLSEQARVARGD